MSTVKTSPHPLILSTDGRAVSTHSMLKTFRRCPQQTYYKFVRRLKPKRISTPLKMGSWMHSLVEAHYKGEDWEQVHAALSSKFYELFEEEQDYYGDLPRECRRLMESYLWHYRDDHWKVHEVEFTLECEWPNGEIYRCKMDLLFEDQFGLWLGDHKFFTKFPDLTVRILDSQSALYVWCALKNKIPVNGFVWNYVRRKAPSIPKLKLNGDLSMAKCDTDFPTMKQALKDYEIPLKRHETRLRQLLAQRYRPGEAQNSPFFHRHPLERDDEMLKRVAAEAYKTHLRANSYFKEGTLVERVTDRSCTFLCSYTDLCALDLWGAPNVGMLERQKYVEGDPLDYYNDKVDRDWKDD